MNQVVTQQVSVKTSLQNTNLLLQATKKAPTYVDAFKGLTVIN